jgi:hypothetical protein
MKLDLLEIFAKLLLSDRQKMSVAQHRVFRDTMENVR